MTAADVTQVSEDPLVTASRRRILEAAERLIGVHGIEKVRLRDIAREAGVSIGKIQHYFDNRDQVIEAMLGAASMRRVEEWATFANDIDDPATKMVSLLEHAITDRERCTVWLATTSVASRNEQFIPDVARIYAAWRAKLVEVIDAGRRDGVFHPTASADEVADGIICAIDGLMTAVAIALTDYTPERNTRMLRHVTGLLLGTRFEAEGDK
ncbi:TetR/AcrR family transcriptional regulator [Rhodococcus sp. NCIMB 12038]|uniref:TetR/AcrR family transcriptional regulator n=1 Tax=Rhodococcus sp. NCIMB 12038 TaxID=933800 RepID=UPI0015C5A2A9|nr:TetR/AcrR family transcriptional regulator [Rhodococcus sp. NCIMB 12038]